MPLSPVEGRVVGCLVEKQLATPQQYPLTLNAVVLACNQTSNRDPVVTYGEHEIEHALETLKQQRLVRFVLPSHGRSVVRYRHVLDEVLGLDPPQLALLAVLLLRGPQTVAELRARAGRLAEVASAEHDLGLLAERPDPLVERRGRRPGEREERWATLLAEPPGNDPAGTGSPGPPPAGAAPAPSAPVQDRGEPPRAEAVGADGAVSEVQSLREELASLRSEVEVLRDETASLRSALAALRESLGG